MICIMVMLLHLIYIADKVHKLARCCKPMPPPILELALQAQLARLWACPAWSQFPPCSRRAPIAGPQPSVHASRQGLRSQSTEHARDSSPSLTSMSLVMSNLGARRILTLRMNVFCRG